MDKKTIAEELTAALKEMLSEPHFFDENSDKCKKCKEFAICKLFNPISNKFKSLDLDKEVAIELADFLDGIKHNYAFVKINSDKPYTNMLRIKLSDIHQRFEDIATFKHYDILVNNLNESELHLIRKVILDTNEFIHKFLDKVNEANRKETNYMLRKLRKPEIEPKSYEDMTKEELIELLNKK